MPPVLVRAAPRAASMQGGSFVRLHEASRSCWATVAVGPTAKSFTPSTKTKLESRVVIAAALSWRVSRRAPFRDSQSSLALSRNAAVLLARRSTFSTTA